MVRKGLQTLAKAVARLHPNIADPRHVIEEGQVTVDGRVVRNPGSMVGRGSAVAVIGQTELRGEAKLRAALDAFQVPIAGRITLDVGAAAGGFTKVLIEQGAAKVYAIDVGFGQLLGSLRQNPRVVNLETTNLADLNREIVVDEIGVFTLDLSYLSLADAIPQLDRLRISSQADLIALVKPMFELHLPRPPADKPTLDKALLRATEGIQAAGWAVLSSIESPVRGGRGAFEFLVHARHPI